MPAVLRRGTRGEAVRDLQRRLGRSGLASAPDDTGEFGEGTERAVRAFQSRRSLRVDGIVGRQTWSSLVESGYSLGDRLLYLRRPMLRGDDVGDLQLRLNALGFDAAREDGIFGEETHHALLEFQRAAGLPADGICGATTIDSLERVGSLAGDSAAGLRERERLRAGPRRLAGRRIYVAAAPGLAVLGERVTRGLLDAGASALLDATGDDDSLVAAEANRFEADLLLALRAGDASGRRCAYFAAPRFTSGVGHEVATEIADELGRVLTGPPEITGRAYPVLRETRMPAVVCELVSEDDVTGMRELVSRAGDAGRAIVRGVARAIEVAVDAGT
jgi:N-acetylmuramoyl-L-alanine amidase